jgi:autotransporter-associated beta strand protein
MKIMTKLCSSHRQSALVAVISVLLIASPLQAATVFFDVDVNGSPASVGTASGSYTWQTTYSTLNTSAWNTAATGSKNSEVGWTNGDIAQFNNGTGTFSVDIVTSGLTIGGLIVSAGNVTISRSGSGTLALASASAFDVATGASLTVSAGFSGAFALSKTSTGTLTLSGANSYTGITTVSAGVLNIQNASALGTTSGGTSVTAGAALELQGSIAIAGEALTINSTGVSTGGALRSISGTNSWSGAITLGSASRINSDSGTLTLSGGITGTGLALTIGGAGNTTINTSGVNTGASGALIKDGAGTLTINASGNYTGSTSINAGTLVMGNASALGTGTISFGGGTLGLFNTTDLSSRFSTAASQQYKIDTNSQSATFATALNSSGATLAKSGGGTLTLSNTNTYSGATTISAGILNLTGSIASSTVSVASGGTLAGSGTASGAVTLSSGGHISPGSSLVSNSVGTLSLGSLTWAAGGVMDFNLGSTSASADKVSVTGAITKSGSGTFSFDFGSSAAGVGQTYTVASAGSWIGWGAPNTDFSFNSSTITGGSFAFNGNNLEFAVTSAIPEPSTYAALAGLGALGLAMYRRRQARETSKLAVTASV